MPKCCLCRNKIEARGVAIKKGCFFNRSKNQLSFCCSTSGAMVGLFNWYSTASLASLDQIQMEI